MGKSPNEQPFLAAYQLRLASANSMATLCGQTKQTIKRDKRRINNGLNKSTIRLEGETMNWRDLQTDLKHRDRDKERERQNNKKN